MKKRLKIKNSCGRHIVYTAGAGVAFWILGEILFSTLTEKISAPFGLPIYFLIFFLVVAAILASSSYFKTDFANAAVKKNVVSSCKLIAILLSVFIVITGLFEFLYELGKQEIPEPTSLIFLIDDSGSMQGTEEDRVNAINSLMADNNTNLPYAVYKFTDNATLIKEMGAYKSSDHTLGLESEGGTEILGAINTVLNDIKNGKLKNAGAYPKILLVSDGASTSRGIRSITKECRNRFISVSTIGVDGCDKGLLQKIADLTGGVFVSCNDISDLAQVLESAISTNTARNLLSERVVFKYDGLYCFLRLFFLSVMGILWTFMKLQLCYEDATNKKKWYILSFALCIVGVVLLEVLSGHAVPIRFLRLVFCVLWAITGGSVVDVKKVSERPLPQIETDSVPVFAEDGQQKNIQKSDMESMNKTITDDFSAGEQYPGGFDHTGFGDSAPFDDTGFSDDIKW